MRLAAARDAARKAVVRRVGSGTPDARLVHRSRAICCSPISVASCATANRSAIATGSANPLASARRASSNSPSRPRSLRRGDRRTRSASSAASRPASRRWTRASCSSWTSAAACRSRKVASRAWSSRRDGADNWPIADARIKSWLRPTATPCTTARPDRSRSAIASSVRAWSHSSSASSSGASIGRVATERSARIRAASRPRPRWLVAM